MTGSDARVEESPERPSEDFSHPRINPKTSIPFFLLNLVPLLAIFTGITWTSVWIFAVLYWGRMFFITAGYHRYFAHRAYKTGRVFQAILAFGGCASAQKGPLWWAGHHRMHHRFSDTPVDPHTPRKGFWWSHVGWILSDETSSIPEGTMKEYDDVPGDPVDQPPRLGRTLVTRACCPSSSEDGPV